jgi:hypothetical protein
VKPFRAIGCALILFAGIGAADAQTAAEIAGALRQIAIDPEQTYRVRDLQLARGDIKVYLTEGVLSFVTPVAGRRVAAVFTTQRVEAGDAEILVLPQQRSERASMASFTKSPNLDEHFTSAVFLFSDETTKEILEQIETRPIRKAPEFAADFAPRLNSVLRNIAADFDVRLVETLLDNHPPSQGFFYSIISGGGLGAFDVLYEPNDFEPVLVGRPAPAANGEEAFQFWTAFRPRHSGAYVPPAPRLHDYRIDTTILPDLSMSVAASFSVTANESDGRVLPFRLSQRLKVDSATIDGKPAEVLQPASVLMTEVKRGGMFLLAQDAALKPGTTHKIEIRYAGSVIRQTGDGGYFVDERNAWYPVSGPTLANFDLTFRCPARLRLVSTGEPVSEEVAGDQRIVHRKTQVPAAMAGFNLGEYDVSAAEHGSYRIECYANKTSAEGMPDIPKQTASVLDYYTQRWMTLPIRSIAVSPIPGSFGQGFPGLIYLSDVSYIREQDRPLRLRNARMDEFFSEMLLPHEVAHQWWGNIVIPAGYRTNWLVEAMANYSALQFLEKSRGPSDVETIFNRYRDDLQHEQDGKKIESAGPIDFGTRLIDTNGLRTWHVIVYEKGTWIIHMLRQRLGEDAFRKMQLRLLQEFAAKPITTADFQKVASEFLPAGQPDRDLSLFFETWVYGTGVPRIVLGRTAEGLSLNISGVDEDFTADLPLHCAMKNGKQQIRWVRASTGKNPLELPANAGSCVLPRIGDFLYLN